MNMNRTFIKYGLLLAVAISIAVLAAAGMLSNDDQHTFSYIGQLNQKGIPYFGTEDVTFTLWDTQDGRSLDDGSNNNDHLTGGNEQNLIVAPDWFINAPNSIYLNIDSDNNSETAVLEIAKDRTGDTGGTVLLKVAESGNVGMGVNPGTARLRVWNLAGNAIDAVASGRVFEAISANGDMAILASNQSEAGMGVFAQHQPSGNQGWIGTPDYGVYAVAGSPAWAGYFAGKAYVDGPLLVGRETTIERAEYFGVHAPISSGDAGMFISTQGESAEPFYGYATDGNERARHFYDGLDRKWQLRIGGADRLTVTDTGRVGIGTTSPGYPLSVATSGPRAISAATSGGIGVTGISSGSTGTGVYGLATSSGDRNYGVYGKSDSYTGYDFMAAGVGINYGVMSSRRWKSNIEPIDDPLNKIALLRGVYFDWDSEHGGHHDVGMIAEEVGAVLPEIVSFEKNGIDAHGMDYSKLTPLLVEAVNALRAEKNSEIQSLLAANNDLRMQNTQLESRLTQLETIMTQLLKTQKNED